LSFYPAKGSLFTLNTSVNNFDPISSRTNFKSLKLNKTGMYILSISVKSSQVNLFNTQCFSNPIRVAKMPNSSINSLNSTIIPTTNNDYVLKFKATDSSISFTSEDTNKIKASIYNYMETFNISVFDLELTSTNGIVSSSSSSSSSRLLLRSQADIITLTFNSYNSNPSFISSLSKLNISETLVFVSATINGVSYDGSDASVNIY